MSTNTPPPEAEEGEEKRGESRVIKLDRRTPEEYRHYAQGWMAAAQAIRQGMRSDVAVLIASHWLNQHEADDPAVPEPG